MAWTAPTTQVTGFLVTAAVWNTDLVDNLTYLNTEVTSGAVQSQPARVWDTTYQAPADHIRVVTISASNTAAGAADRNMTVYVAAGTPPATVIAKSGLDDVNFANIADYFATVSFVVPSSYYYHDDAVGLTLVYWTEWELH